MDYSPVSWREYFDHMEDVNVGSADSRDVFRIYKAGSDGPLLVLLHGGGHSALSWAVFTVSICTLSPVIDGSVAAASCMSGASLGVFCVADGHYQQSDLQSARHGPQGSR